ncbi:helix-turn-helix transcriptional regulator [Paenibacillus sp. SYP-B3998]|uniref:Helix-turn-helix transcriptional regulator n=1 Tax=Paenibacillus sp. SYP-B3998 TaxID=2678564 RepID=A0A6G3ZT74_9BACL|nr:AraC family transcriptional regulator [Paenibacillus sp. SYP-B3998]NEW04904.1 helix-turn-helix transcriptional regulator [Paenibacillus sp. SYP-B3998]
MSDRTVKVPQGLEITSNNQSTLKVQGFTVVESCTRTRGKQGSMFLDDHLLLFVLEGIYKIHFGNQTYIVRKNEMVLLQRAIVIHYEKSGEPNKDYSLEYMMFFLKDELLKEFIKMSNIKFTQPSELVPVLIHPVNVRLQKYIESIKPYFNESEKIEDSLVRIKLLELLFDIASEKESMMQQLLQLKQQVRSNLSMIIEENIMNPVSIKDLAYLSGRSLSSFKRDFQSIYNMPPSKWIQQRRLEKAKELLTYTAMSVTDVCFTTGFENATHFSKVFKDYFGCPPSSLKQELS